jgi:hypothetical protein
MLMLVSRVVVMVVNDGAGLRFVDALSKKLNYGALS